MMSHARHQEFLSRGYFSALDGLRGIAIIEVVWHHAAGHRLPGLLGRGLGVELFFALTGVLITHLLLREQGRSGGISLRKFYIRRTLRTFPVYYATILLYVVLVFAFDRHSAAGAKFFSNLPYFLTHTANWFVIKWNWFVDPEERIIFYFAWSLATTEQFYLFWPAIVRFARRWYTPVAVMIVLMSASEIARWGISARWLDSDPVIVRIVASVATPVCLGSLAAYLLHCERGFRIAYRIGGQPWSAPVAVAALVAACSLEVPRLLVSTAITFLVVSCMVGPASVLRALLESRVLKYVGTISYSMYLLQMIAINIVHRLLPRFSPFTVFIFALPLAMLFAGFSYRFFEQRFLALKDSFIQRQAAAAACVLPAAPPSASALQ